jgi:hypothetical protein
VWIHAKARSFWRGPASGKGATTGARTASTRAEGLRSRDARVLMLGTIAGRRDSGGHCGTWQGRAATGEGAAASRRRAGGWLVVSWTEELKRVVPTK